MTTIGSKVVGDKASQTAAKMHPTTPVWVWPGGASGPASAGYIAGSAPTSSSSTAATASGKMTQQGKNRLISDYPQLTKDDTSSYEKAKYDVAVIGGGIFGVTSAYLLKKAGKRVALIEASKIGSGTTGSSTAKLSAQQHLMYTSIASKYDISVAQKYGEMQLSAIEQAESIVKELKIESECQWRRKPSYTWTSDKNHLREVEDEYNAMKGFGWPVELIGSNIEEMPKSVEVMSAVKLADQVEFNPYLFCGALAQDIADGSNGSVVYENSRVIHTSEGVITEKEHKIQTDSGAEIIADYVIMATHMPILDRSGHFGILKASRSHCLLFKLTKPVLDGMWISAEEPLKSLRVVGEDRRHLLVSGEPMDQGKDVDTNQHYTAIEEWVRKHFPVDEISAKWSAMDYYSGDHLPYIGLLHRGTKSIYTATGFAKWGLANGVAAAMIVRDSIQKKDNPFAAMVDARRWELIKTLPTILEENLHVTKHLVGDKLKAMLKSLPSVDTLKSGEGGLAKTKDGETVGAYIDDSGHRFAVKPVCTHLGCNLNFNKGDLAWDCPCHGSRFDVDGKVVHGPAVKNLEKVDLDW